MAGEAVPQLMGWYPGRAPHRAARSTGSSHRAVAGSRAFRLAPMWQSPLGRGDEVQR